MAVVRLTTYLVPGITMGTKVRYIRVRSGLLCYKTPGRPLVYGRIYDIGRPRVGMRSSTAVAVVSSSSIQRASCTTPPRGVSPMSAPNCSDMIELAAVICNPRAKYQWFTSVLG